MIEAIVAVVFGFGVISGIIAVSIWFWKITNPCPHTYERIDTPNDKKVILVCRRCGKIKKIGK